MFGVMEFYKKCISNNIKPIIGLEIIVDNEILVLYAKDYNGYKYRLVNNGKQCYQECNGSYPYLSVEENLC